MYYNMHVSFCDLFFLPVNIVKTSLVSVNPDLDIVSMAWALFQFGGLTYFLWTIPWLWGLKLFPLFHISNSAARNPLVCVYVFVYK